MCVKHLPNILLWLAVSRIFHRQRAYVIDFDSQADYEINNFHHWKVGSKFEIFRFNSWIFTQDSLSTLMNCYQWGPCLSCEIPSKEPIELAVIRKIFITEEIDQILLMVFLLIGFLFFIFDKEKKNSKWSSCRL